MHEGTRSRSCERFRGDLSAFVDHTLPQRRWVQVAYHVAGCAGCRGEADATREVTQVLREAGRRGQQAPEVLADRLRGIAGEDHESPLYMHPVPGEGLPSRRREVRRRALHGSVVAATALVSVFVLALLLAPDPPPLRHPSYGPWASPSLAAGAVAPREVGAVPALLTDQTSNGSHALTEPTWCAEHCPTTLAGLPLVRAKVLEEHRGVRLLYSDGSQVLDVSFLQGVLEEEPGRDGPPARTEAQHAVWQAGNLVVMVSTNAGPALLTSAMAELPARRPYEPSLSERVFQGLARVAGIN